MALQQQISIYREDIEQLLDRYYPIKLFGNTLKHMLNKQEVTQRNFSKITPFDESTISKWCTGTQLPGWESLDIVSDDLKLSTKDEASLRVAYNWDQWLRNALQVIEETGRIVEQEGPTMSEDKLRQAYLQKMHTIRSLLTPYETYKERESRIA